MTGEVVSQSVNENIGGQAEELIVVPEGGEYDLVIGLVDGAAPKLMKWVLKYGKPILEMEANPPADASTIINQANYDLRVV